MSEIWCCAVGAEQNRKLITGNISVSVTSILCSRFLIRGDIYEIFFCLPGLRFNSFFHNQQRTGWVNRGRFLLLFSLSVWKEAEKTPKCLSASVVQHLLQNKEYSEYFKWWTREWGIFLKFDHYNQL